MIKKLSVGLLLTCALLGSATVARAATLEDLLSLVQQLRQEVVELKGQLQATAIRSVSTTDTSLLSTKTEVVALPRDTKVLTPVKLGDSGEAVKTVQIELKSQGYYPGPVTGVYGKETARAVATLQKATGISGDGSRVGTQTIAAITGNTLPAQIPNGGQPAQWPANPVQLGTPAQVLLLGGVSLSPSNPIEMNDVWTTANGSSWTQLLVNGPTSSTHWAPRKSFGAVYFQNKYWVFGGGSQTNGGSVDVWNSVDGATWNLVSSNAPLGENAEIAVFNNQIWVFGGTSYYQGYVHSTADGVTWNAPQVTNTACVNRAGGEAVIFQNKIFLIGGVPLPNGGVAPVCSSPDGINWTVTSPNAIVPTTSRVDGPSVFVLGNKIWVFGGQVISSSNQITASTNTMYSSSDGITWSTYVPPTVPPVRAYSPAFVLGNKAYIAGGGNVQGVNSTGITNDIWSFDGTTWSQVLANAPFVERLSHRFIVKPGTIPNLGQVPATNLPVPVSTACSANPVITVNPVLPASQIVTQGQANVQVAEIIIKNYSSCTYKIRSVFPTYNADAGTGNSSLLSQFTNQFVLPTFLTYSVNGVVVGQGSISAGSTATTGIPLSLGITPNSTKTIKVAATVPNLTGYSGFKLQPRVVKWMNVDLSGQIFQVTPQTNYTNATWFTVQ